MDGALSDITHVERDDDFESRPMCLVKEIPMVQIVVPVCDAEGVGSQCLEEGKIARPEILVLGDEEVAVGPCPTGMRTDRTGRVHHALDEKLTNGNSGHTESRPKHR